MRDVSAEYIHGFKSDDPPPAIKDALRDLQARIFHKPRHKEAISQDVLVDVRSFLSERRASTDQWFFLVRIVLALGLLGYLVVDTLSGEGAVPVDLVLVGTYLLTNLFVWLAAEQTFGFTRWFYAGLDFLFFLLQRHLFLFEATVDPNATMVGFFSLLLIAYVSYSDPKLLGTMALLMIVATGITIWLDVLRLDNPSLGPVLGEITFRTQPLRILLLLGYLVAVGLVTHMLARRLRVQVTAYSSELLKRAQAAMNTAVERARRERLEELNRLKRDFIAVLSHELRTPITPLRTSLEMAQNEIRPGDSAREMIDIAVDASTRLQRLVQDYTRLAELLTLEGAGADRWNMRLNDLLNILLPVSKSGRYVLQDVEELVVSGDPRLLGGAIVALLRRADLVTPDDGHITFRGHSEDRSVVFSIHDPASYVDPKSTLNLSDPFAYSSERTFFSANTGLELILAQHSIQRVGGHISVESSKGEGTTVYVSIPGARDENGWLTPEDLRQELSTFSF